MTDTKNNVRQLDWSNFAGPKRNTEWKPDDQDLIYTAINFRDDEWGDADEDAGQQIVERLLHAWQEAEMAAAHYAHHRRELLDAVQPALQPNVVDRFAPISDQQIRDIMDCGDPSTARIKICRLIYQRTKPTPQQKASS